VELEEGQIRGTAGLLDWVGAVQLRRNRARQFKAIIAFSTKEKRRYECKRGTGGSNQLAQHDIVKAAIYQGKGLQRGDGTPPGRRERTWSVGRKDDRQTREENQEPLQRLLVKRIFIKRGGGGCSTKQNTISYGNLLKKTTKGGGESSNLSAPRTAKDFITERTQSLEGDSQELSGNHHRWGDKKKMLSNLRERK